MALFNFVVVLLSLVALFDSSSAAICKNPESYSGKVVSDPWGGYRGECVSFVKTCTGDHRPTSQWRKGPQVKGKSLPKGTAIATFPNGSYKGHAAIYVGQDSTGIQVWDQGNSGGRPVGQRTIRWNGSSMVNDGNQFYVIQ